MLFNRSPFETDRGANHKGLAERDAASDIPIGNIECQVPACLPKGVVEGKERIACRSISEEGRDELFPLDNFCMGLGLCRKVGVIELGLPERAIVGVADSRSKTDIPIKSEGFV